MWHKALIATVLAMLGILAATNHCEAKTKKVKSVRKVPACGSTKAVRETLRFDPSNKIVEGWLQLGVHDGKYNMLFVHVACSDSGRLYLKTFENLSYRCSGGVPLAQGKYEHPDWTRVVPSTYGWYGAQVMCVEGQTKYLECTGVCTSSCNSDDECEACEDACGTRLY